MPRGDKRAFIFDRGSKNFERLPDMADKRGDTVHSSSSKSVSMSLYIIGDAQAGLVTYSDGNKAIIVAGGQDSKSTEIFDLSQKRWKWGPDLPVSSKVRQGQGNLFKMIDL